MKVTLITVRLTMRSPGGVTAPEDGVQTVVGSAQGEQRVRNLLPLRRDPAGALQVPGTTVAGSLRAHCAPRPLLAGLFGSEPGDAELVASTIRVLGCVLRTQPHEVIRTRTAIDRHRGAPANRTLHAVEQLPAGTEFDVVLRWDDPQPDQLAELEAALRCWAPCIGRGSSLGAGRCEVTGLGRADYDLASVAGLLDWLDVRGPDDYPPPTGVTTTATRSVHRQVRFAVVDPVRIGSGGVRKDEQDRQVATVLRSGDDVVVPGSSIKGVLRSRVEYICRICSVPVCAGTEPSTCPTGQPCLPCRTFGRAADRDGHGARRAAVAIPDAVVSDAVVETRQHVALDRFTGGARPELLYSEDVVVTGRFTIRLDELAGPLAPADAALVDAALADLGDGLVGIGARTTAGYGTVRIDDDAWSPPELGALADTLHGVAP